SSRSVVGAGPRRLSWAVEPRQIISDPHPRGAVVPAHVPLGFAVDGAEHGGQCDAYDPELLHLAKQGSSAGPAEGALNSGRRTETPDVRFAREEPEATRRHVEEGAVARPEEAAADRAMAVTAT